MEHIHIHLAAQCHVRTSDKFNTWLSNGPRKFHHPCRTSDKLNTWLSNGPRKFHHPCCSNQIGHKCCENEYRNLALLPGVSCEPSGATYTGELNCINAIDNKWRMGNGDPTPDWRGGRQANPLTLTVKFPNEVVITNVTVWPRCSNIDQSTCIEYRLSSGVHETTRNCTGTLQYFDCDNVDPEQVVFPMEMNTTTRFIDAKFHGEFCNLGPYTYLGTREIQIFGYNCP